MRVRQVERKFKIKDIGHRISVCLVMIDYVKTSAKDITLMNNGYYTAKKTGFLQCPLPVSPNTIWRAGTVGVTTQQSTQSGRTNGILANVNKKPPVIHILAVMVQAIFTAGFHVYRRSELHAGVKVLILHWFEINEFKAS